MHLGNLIAGGLFDVGGHVGHDSGTKTVSILRTDPLTLRTDPLKARIASTIWRVSWLGFGGWTALVTG